MGQTAHGLAVDEILARLHRVGIAVDAVLQRRCVYRAGANAIAANALAHVIGRHAFGQTNDGRFARAIDETVGQAANAGAHTGHVDDAATLAVFFELRQHFGDGRLNHPELRAHVQVEGKVPILVSGQFDAAVVHKACAVEDDVDAWQAGHLGGNRFFVENVQNGGVHIRHALVRLEQLGVHIGRIDRGALSGHGQCRCMANALPGGGDECNFSFESHGALISSWVICLAVMATQSQAMPRPGVSGGRA